jgi:hypothetical protein
MPDIVKLIEEAKAAHSGPTFLSSPEAWLEDPHWWCKNGHLSGSYVGSDEHGATCAVCREIVYLGPPELPGVVPL